MNARLFGLVSTVTLLLFIGAATARGDEWILNENGSGALVTGAAQAYSTNQDNGTMMPDPSGGIMGRPVLVFSVGSPFCVPVSGDIALVDVNNGGTITHLLRFYSSGMFGSYLIFYANDGSHSAADVGLPAFSNPVQLVNQGPSGTYWDPSGSQPGAGASCGTQPVGSPQGFIFVAQFPVNSGTAFGPLQIARSTNVVNLSWPAVLTNYSLCAKTNLTATNWVTVTNSVSISNNLRQVTLPTTADHQYFRLQ